jgi:hypothetical protein
MRKVMKFEVEDFGILRILILGLEGGTIEKLS